MMFMKLAELPDVAAFFASHCHSKRRSADGTDADDTGADPVNDARKAVVIGDDVPTPNMMPVVQLVNVVPLVLEHPDVEPKVVNVVNVGPLLLYVMSWVLDRDEALTVEPVIALPSAIVTFIQKEVSPTVVKDALMRTWFENEPVPCNFKYFAASFFHRKATRPKLDPQLGLLTGNHIA